MRATATILAWVVLGLALACAPEADPPGFASCTAEVPCAQGHCVSGWCAEVTVKVRPDAPTLRCDDLTYLGLVTDILPYQLDPGLDLALGRGELYVDGELAATVPPGWTYAVFEPAFASGRCHGFAEGDHVVSGGRMASDGWIAAEPATLHVDLGPAFVGATPDPAVALPRGPVAVRFQFAEALAPHSWAQRQSGGPVYGWTTTRPQPEVIEIAFEAASWATWVEITVQPYDLDGIGGAPVQVRWNFAP